MRLGRILMLPLAAICLAGTFSCEEKPEKEPEEEEQEPVIPSDTTFAEAAATVKLNVAEPSGIALSRDRLTMFVISDNGEISEIRPATGAKKAFVFTQSGYDWEGFCLDRSTDILYAVQEKGNKVYSFSGDGHKTSALFYDATIPGTNDGSDNYGCEGLTCHDGVMYLGNQKNPCLIQTVDMATKEVTANTKIGFVQLISDLCYDEEDDTMWILESNASKEGGNCIPKLYNCTVPDFTLRYTITLPRITQAEGVEIDRKGGKIYICCDNTSNLYTFNYDFK